MSDSIDDLGQPSSYVLLESGAPVYSCDGEKVGTVKEVRANEDLDIFDGLVLDSCFVSGDQVEEIFEKGVLLKLDAEAAKKLPASDRNSGGA